MQIKKFYRLSVFAAIFSAFLFTFANAQESSTAPEMSVVGIKLGDRESAKKYLLSGHVPRVDEEGRTSYFFYNEWGTQVMRLTVASADDPYFITEIEVFAVNDSYRKRHYQDTKNGLMPTENGIFIGFRQTAFNLIVGVRNVGKANTIGPSEVVKLKGEPNERVTIEKDRELLKYEVGDVELDDESTADYRAEYEFYKKKLKRFLIKIDPTSN